ncbi:MAG TPA: class I SAM-dependent methyltransferase [Bacillus sp. (in: firmicutes)]|uniref:class I SAM-dependent methyltransferase n=1 Tax=Bacillus litorisediminis TaxID=2922713 RepID=UPI001FAC2D3B|nr:class I SAM-dependent methyltransferase [Bacillus litorisediminis]HWO75478.1 class I SAM-dependent methyltransferase [Bacillus sp. (in: firmicutes)]
MLGSKVENLFHVLDQTTEILMQSCQLTYLEALVETGENLFQGDILQPVDDVAKKRMEKLYQSIKLEMLSKEEIRRAFQLVTLKGMRDYVQPHHQMTPDSIGILISGLLREFLINGHIETFTLLDPAVGTGNLVATIQNQLSDYAIEAYGVEVDDVLLKLAYVQANLQEQSIQLYNQDALEPLFIDPVDVVVSDLPVGYYPRKEFAKEYQLDREEGHAFSHYLFIEQSLKHTKPGGLLFFVIPNDLFEGEDAAKLHAFLKEHAFIQGLIQLPLSMFKNERNAKSIFILKKKKEGEAPPKKVFMAQMPKLTNKNAVQDIISQIRIWLREEAK